MRCNTSSFTLYWPHVDIRGADDCWPWKGTHDEWGYGIFALARPDGVKTTTRGHIFGLILASGEDQRGRLALHTCDNPPCCNPLHLYWGTQSDNMQDMHRRGRAARLLKPGQDHYRAKLRDPEVLSIRARWAAGEQQKDLAADYQVSAGLVSMIVNRKRWSHL